MTGEVAVTGVGLLAPAREVSPERHLKDRKALKYMDRLSKMAVHAAGDALADARIDLAGVDPRRVGLAMAVGHVAADLSDFVPVIAAGRAPDGSFDAAALGRSNRINPIAVFKTLSNIPVCNVSIALGLKGDNLILYPDAPQAARALEEGAWAVRDGAADVVLTGGVASGNDFLNVHRRAMFDRGASPRLPAADGAVVLVLERRASAGARARGLLHTTVTVGGDGPTYRGCPSPEAFASAIWASGAALREIAFIVSGAMTDETRAAQQAGLVQADLADRPLVDPAADTGDMGPASFAYGVHVALERLRGETRPLALVLAVGNQGDVACTVVAKGDGA